MMEKIKELLTSKEDINKKINQFSWYLQNHMPPESQIDREFPLGKFLRVMRYYDLVEKACKNSPIPSEYVMALMMVEWQGNPSSINETDGGAWLIHFQDETANEYGVKVFTKTDEYEHIYGKSHRPKQGKILDLKLQKPYTLDWMAKFDERFDPKKNIIMTTKYLTYIRNIVEKNYEKNTSHESWDKHKNDKEFDFKTLLTLNGFNKGPQNFAKRFGEGTHIEWIKRDLKAYRDFLKLTKQCLLNDLSWDVIIQKLEKKAYERVWKTLPKKTPSLKNIEKRNEKSFGDFDYIRENKDGKEIYSYTIKQSWQSIENIKSIVVNKYKQQNEDLFVIDANYVVNEDWTPLESSQRLQSGDKVYIVVPSLLERIANKIL